MNKISFQDNILIQITRQITQKKNKRKVGNFRLYGGLKSTLFSESKSTQ